MTLRAPALAVVALLAACGSDETSLRVVVESDLSVPDEVDALRLQVVGATLSRDFTFDVSGPFPHTTDVTAGKDHGEAVELTVTGLHEGRAVASTRQAARFVEGERIEVVLRLGDCASCDDGGVDGGDGDADADADADGDTDADADGDADVWRPSNLAEDALPVPVDVEDFSFQVSTIWSTDTGEIAGEAGGIVRAAGEGVIDGIGFSIHPQVGGPSIGAWSFHRLAIGDAATVILQGSAAAAWIAADEIVVAGGVAAGAAGREPGPGGGRGAPEQESDGDAEGAGAGASVVLDLVSDPGGGGGGFAGAGGAGGAGEGPGAAGGVTYGEETLAPLLGGSGGGCGGRVNSGLCAAGGGGGGALQIFSRVLIRVEDSGAIEAGGAGGAAGVVEAAYVGGGSGGGSGGGLLLEAPVVEIAGRVAANGGGGGAGPLLEPSEDGEHGRLDGLRAQGGGGAPAVDGGDGGAAGVPDGDPGSAGREGAGGGGGIGRIRVNTAGSEARITGTVSPPASEGELGRVP